jgi:hypothetical protein
MNMLYDVRSPHAHQSNLRAFGLKDFERYHLFPF